MNKLRQDLKRYGGASYGVLATLSLTAGYVLAVALIEVASLQSTHVLILLLLAVVIALTSSRHPIKFPGTHNSVSMSEAVTFLAVMVLGPTHGALLTAVDQALASRRLKLRPSLYLFNVANHTISIYVAGQAYSITAQHVAGQELTGGVAEALIGFAAPLAALSFTHYTLHLTVVALMSRLTHGTPLWETVRDTLPWEPITYIACATVSGLIGQAFNRYGLVISLVTLVIVLPVPIIIYYTFKTYQDKLGEQQTHYEELTGIYDSILEMLAMAIDAKDDVTHDHLQRVKLFARRMGEIVGLSDPEIEALKAGALLHDIGKIGVPAYILNKPGRLTEHEFEQMKMHTIIGADMLSNIDFRYPIVPVVRHHHERWDGSGYPDGLKGEEIPITARILTLVDNYDALRSNRPYKRGMSRQQALEYIKENSGTFFDPRLVELFLDVVDQLEAEAAELARDAANRRRPGSAPMAKSGPAAGLHASPPVDRAAAALTSIAETNQRVTALCEMSRTLPSLLSVEDSLAVLASRLAQLIPFTTCAISVFHASHSEVEVVHAVGLHADKFLKRRLPVNAGITGWVIANQRAMYNTNPVLDLGFLGTDLASQYKGVMVFPLVKSIVIGAVALYSTEIETYAGEYIQLMEWVSQPASDAVYNALTYEQAQRAALAQQECRIATTSAITDQIERERARSQRSGAPLSLIVVSLNNLYQAAASARSSTEDVMTWLGDLIRQQVRETDIVARQTDNAFVAVLPESGHAEASEVRDRISRAIQDSARGRHLDTGIGSATSPDDGHTFEELLHAAQTDREARHRALPFPVGSSESLTTGAL